MRKILLRSRGGALFSHGLVWDPFCQGLSAVFAFLFR
jgi:hypothetical protein